MFRALLIDDEAGCLKQLSNLLAMCCADTVQVIGQSQTVEAALLVIEELQPDLLFLDVGLNDNKNGGFSLLGAVSQETFDVIFVTGHSEHAQRAFDVAAIDYLLKPVSPDKLSRAILRVKSRSQIKRGDKPVRVPEKIRIGEKEINLSTIVYFESDGSYTNLYVCGKKMKDRTITSHLGVLEKSLLGNPDFFRIHDKYLINMEHFISYVEGRGGTAFMKDGVPLSVAARRKAAFKKRIQELYDNRNQ